MNEHNVTPNSLITKDGYKDKSEATQLQTIFLFLKENIATASMVADVTGIYQKNICRYKRDLEQAGQLSEIEKTKCKLTGFKAWYLTTDPAKAPKRLHQLNLFSNAE